MDWIDQYESNKTEVDRIGSMWTKWTEVDWIRPSGLNRTLVNRID